MDHPAAGIERRCRRENRGRRQRLAFSFRRQVTGERRPGRFEVSENSRNFMQHFLRSGLLVVNVALLAVVATGCATVIPPSNLLPASYQVQHKHSATVTVKVMSGQVEAETYAHFTGDGFAEALAQAIRKSGVFAQAQTSGGGDYLLEGSVNVEYQGFGASFTHHIRSHWKLIRQADSKEVWSDLISTSHTATMGDAIIGAKRQRLATEGVGRKCIQEIIKRLSMAQI